MRKRVLMITGDFAGNFPPERALVRALVGRGHDVHVLAHDVQAASIAADGATFHTMPSVVQRVSTDHTDRLPSEDRRWMIENVFTAEGYGTDLKQKIDELEPDLLLVDAFLMSALRAGKSSGTPTVALGHSVHSPLGTSPFGPTVEASDLVIVFSYRVFDPAEALPSNIRFAAPRRPEQPFAERSANPGGRRSIVVSLSTSFQQQSSLIQRLCDATRDLDADVLVTTGGAFSPDQFTGGANTRIVVFASHDAVLPSTDLLVTHAGHGTVMAGAGYGVPMVCIPMGRDQPFVAAQAERLGLCKVVPPEADTTELRATIVGALADKDLAQNARAFAAMAAHLPGFDEVVAELETLM